VVHRQSGPDAEDAHSTDQRGNVAEACPAIPAGQTVRHGGNIFIYSFHGY